MTTIAIEEKRFDFEPLNVGESFLARNITFRLKDGTVPTSNLSAIHMYFYDEKGTEVKHIYNGAVITITDAVNWVVTLSLFDITFDVGKYKYKIKVTDAASETYFPQWGYIDIID
jgi:hypothetical protein